MHPEAVQLEALRQKIEDVLYESGNQSDYLDRGKPNASQAKKAQELMTDLNNQGKTLQAELKQLIVTTRSTNPQAVEEWVNYHIDLLQKIVDEKSNEKNAAVRKNVAKGTIQEWEKVQAGEQDYVNINWYFLKDYKAEVRSITGGTPKKAVSPSASKTEDKAWWQFWK